MSDELKPCPFCGEDARKSDNGHDVYCLGCGARIAVGAFEGTAQKKDALRVAWWNQRVAQEVPAPADPFMPDAEEWAEHPDANWTAITSDGFRVWHRTPLWPDAFGNWHEWGTSRPGVQVEPDLDRGADDLEELGLDFANSLRHRPDGA